MNVSESLKSRTMKSDLLLPGARASSDAIEQNKLVVSTVNKVGETSERSFANGITEHVKGKLSIGAKILQLGGKEKVYNRIFNVREGERLLKASQCCLYTTAGPITGLLFISTDKLAFCSNRPVVKVSSSTGDLLRFHYYKVIIPLRKIKIVSQSENTTKKSQKYLQVVTADDFEFWFMGFLNYKKTFKCLQQAISQL